MQPPWNQWITGAQRQKSGSAEEPFLLFPPPYTVAIGAEISGNVEPDAKLLVA